MTSHSPICNKFTTIIQHKKRRLFFYIAIVLVTITSTLFSRSLETFSPDNKTRNVKSDENNQGIPAWALDNAKPLRATARTGEDVSLFWHIPKSGGTTG
jgi:hypothetical protein